MTRFNPFASVDCSRGAPIGRPDTSNNFAAFDGVPLAKLCARHCGGDGQYDRGGAYWGHSRVFAVWKRGAGANGCAYVEASSAGDALRIVSEACARRLIHNRGDHSRSRRVSKMAFLSAPTCLARHEAPMLQAIKGTKMLYQILNRFTRAVQVEVEISCHAEYPARLQLGLAVRAAIKIGANLRDANLRGADLGGANLGGADLGGANLRGADFRGANLGGADLRDADFRGANLGGADLGDADLRDASLRDADFRGANLGGANLGGADLGGADFRGANLGCADLASANLNGADLGGADLGGADLIDGGLRSDGYRFVGWKNAAGVLMLRAGCRDFTLPEARLHWLSTRGDTPLGRESLEIVDHIERLAAIRGWTVKTGDETGSA